MAAAAGLKPWETDAASPNDVWTQIDGWGRNQRMEWERTRAVCFNVATFGNSDSRRMPKTKERFMPFSWDKAGVPKSNDILSQHARMKARRDQLEKQHG